MVEDTIGVHDVMATDLAIVILLDIEDSGAYGRKTATQDSDILASRIRRKDAATAVQEEARMIADSGANFEHSFSAKIDPQRCEMLLATPVVALVVVGRKAMLQVHDLQLQRGNLPLEFDDRVWEFLGGCH